MWDKKVSPSEVGFAQDDNKSKRRRKWTMFPCFGGIWIKRAIRAEAERVVEEIVLVAV